MESAGIIRRSSSPRASPLQMVKKPDGSWRPCGVYRRLNTQTIPDRYPLPNIADFSSRLHGSKVFTKLDLTKGYYQVPMSTGDIPKTAVITPFSLFEWLRIRLDPPSRGYWIRSSKDFLTVLYMWMTALTSLLILNMYETFLIFSDSIVSASTLTSACLQLLQWTTLV